MAIAYHVERELKPPNKTLYKLATSERDLPEKHLEEVTGILVI